jgi:hypothetical protein
MYLAETFSQQVLSPILFTCLVSHILIVVKTARKLPARVFVCFKLTVGRTIAK